MVNLGDYLGQFLSELTIARAQADLEAIRMAEIYTNHELLKYLPVPRFRINDVNLDIPVVIIKTENPPPKGSPRGGLRPEDLQPRFMSVLARQLELHSLTIDDKEREELVISIGEITKQLARPEFLPINSNLAADKITSAVTKIFKQKGLEIGPKNIDGFVEAVRQAARTDFINAQLDVPRVVIGATSAEIREASPESVVRVSLRISEEGLEQTHIPLGDDVNSEGNLRLVPE